ncbi:helix-turn-helix domain-containing protein [Oryzomonas sagensis]|uniref:Helix-turn-helix domain-containing protein n=1 Tax=Oryzomonas sagensis TaxID=2603857 RepID=A0ABQ6TPF0_9BACT|nr:helix-turn-helix transcriptional regulator [Oryzomonas sagensis]KAB0670464.1 helix-turn-helix domain-containing protein [Oryzomonas sagensis]
MDGRENPLGEYLKDRRTKLDPVALGFSMVRRRTPGLRREEVAQRANVSATWYTWLEQGRGGAPSADVLDRLARALLLTDAEREHMFLLALGRLPEVSYKPVDGITPRLQRILDSLCYSPAFVRTSTWDIVGWNKAASVVFGDFGELDSSQRNILRRFFMNPQIQSIQADWEHVAHSIVAAFRADIARTGATNEVKQLINELCRSSSEFNSLWQKHDILANGDCIKRLHHPVVGSLTLDYSSFSVDGRPDLALVIYNPATREDEGLIHSLFEKKSKGRGSKSKI